MGVRWPVGTGWPCGEWMTLVTFALILGLPFLCPLQKEMTLPTCRTPNSFNFFPPQTGKSLILAFYTYWITDRWNDFYLIVHEFHSGYWPIIGQPTRGNLRIDKRDSFDRSFIHLEGKLKVLWNNKIMDPRFSLPKWAHIRPDYPSLPHPRKKRWPLLGCGSGGLFLGIAKMEKTLCRVINFRLRSPFSPQVPFLCLYRALCHFSSPFIVPRLMTFHFFSSTLSPTFSFSCLGCNLQVAEVHILCFLAHLTYFNWYQLVFVF